MSSGQPSSSRPRKRTRFTDTSTPRPDNNPSEDDALAGASKRPRSEKALGKRPLRLACAQCRRQNLPCDDTFPCTACIKSGCAQACPGGVPPPGRRLRVPKATQMQAGDGQQQAEARLADASPPRAELRPSHHPAAEAGFGIAGGSRSALLTPPAERDRSTSTTTPLFLDEISIADTPQEQMSAPRANEIPHIVSRCRGRVTLGSEEPMDAIRQMSAALPSREHANFLCEQAKSVALCNGFSPQDNEHLTILMQDVYDTLPALVCPFKLSVVFAILAMGMEASARDDVVSDSASAYHLLARAAACLPSSAPDSDVNLLTALFFMIAYLLIFRDDEANMISARGILTASARVCNELGMDADKAVGLCLPVRRQRRRVIFWQLVASDTMLALARRDEPSFPLQGPDNRCTVAPNAAGSTTSLEWRQQYVTRCVTPVLGVIRAASTYLYTRVVKLDAAIRDFPIPSFLRMPSLPESPRSMELTSQRAYISIQRDFLVTQLHRTYFIQAISEPHAFSYTHPHVCSVLATYQNACQIIACLALVMRSDPEACRRIPCLWTQTFTAAAGLCFIVSKIPGDPLATLSRPQIDKCVKLFQQAKVVGQEAAAKIQLLESLAAKSTQVYLDWQRNVGLNGQSTWPSPPSMLTPNSDSNSSPQTADPYAYMHPILLRLLQQAKARALAVQSKVPDLPLPIPSPPKPPVLNQLPTPSTSADVEQPFMMPVDLWNAVPTPDFSSFSSLVGPSTGDPSPMLTGDPLSMVGSGSSASPFDGFGSGMEWLMPPQGPLAPQDILAPTPGLSRTLQDPTNPHLGPFVPDPFMF
ncbi:hypothetical protein PENSPDRAFT_734875 [Peniophora sp. CONT]|nr:hypothetical protein PENSPDRAFT_734875 [Peniophora sp. CONT]